MYPWKMTDSNISSSYTFLTAACGFCELDGIPRHFQEVVYQVYSSRWRESLSLKFFWCNAKLVRVWVSSLSLLKGEGKCQLLWMFAELKLYLESGVCANSEIAPCFHSQRVGLCQALKVFLTIIATVAASFVILRENFTWLKNLACWILAFVIAACHKLKYYLDNCKLVNKLINCQHL